MTAKRGELALRDPAAEALFGVSADFGDEFGEEFGEDDEDYGDDEFGADEDGEEIEIEEADMGAAVKAGARYGRLGGRQLMVRRPPARTVSRPMVRTVVRRKAGVSAAVVAQRARVAQANRARMSRLMRLDPNHGSPLKIEIFRLQMSDTLTFGTASALVLNTTPAVTFKPNKLICNAPFPGMVTLSTIQASNINCLVGAGVVDAYDFNALAQDSSMELPKLSPAHRVQIVGAYSGRVCVPYITATAFDFTATFIGHAKMVG